MLNLGPFPSDATIAAAVKNALAAAGVTISAGAPATPDGNMLLVAGDSYRVADGRGITFDFAGGPSLAGATVILTATAVVDDEIAFNPTGAVSGTSVTFELSSDQTSPLFSGDCAYAYAVTAALANEDIVTLGVGFITVTD